MRRLLKVAGLLALLTWTWVLCVYHLGVLSPPDVRGRRPAQGRFIDKSVLGINQLILEGDAYGGGLKSGELTKPLLLLQEKELTDQLFRLIPEWLFRIVEVPLIRFFWGADRYVELWMLEEMYGVSRSAPHEFDRLIDGYTRQLAYHGLHEVGQMMVDQGGDVMGCTVVAAPFGKDWVLGRNFDFEGGQVLDREKIVKWVFPEHGYSYVSVIWAGMVGAVTAVNEQGIYISINAAGSSDRRRYGMPSTLLLVKALMAARTASEAIAIFQSTPMFITDIFVLLDSKSGELYRIEKSPLKTEVVALHGPSVVANHLVAPPFLQDKVNLYRRRELTTSVRSERAEELLHSSAFSPERVRRAQDLELPILRILRDKGQIDGKPLNLGNRQAIDAMIATHAVVYNSADRVLFVSQGPALVGPFVGFDLKASFNRREPVVVRRLPHDPLVSDAEYERVKDSARRVDQAARLLRSKNCGAARGLLDAVTFFESAAYYKTSGDWAAKCQGDATQAKELWRKAMALHPAYARERSELNRLLGGT